mmetsp:Transcript_10634/g.24284  ORF Transcript_10634/g.24284 Transcript_10634/m.24284 type:complete len:94 (-) Transcript_10634:108-389(-)
MRHHVVMKEEGGRSNSCAKKKVPEGDDDSCRCTWEPISVLPSACSLQSIFDDAVANVPFDESSSIMLAFDEKDGSEGGRLVSSEMTVSNRSKD